MDIDGTICYRDLITKKQIIPFKTRKTIENLRKQGHKVYIATGRSYFSAKEVLKDLEFDGYLCSCGSFFISGSQILIDDPLSINDLKIIKNCALKYNIYLMFECMNNIFVDKNWQNELKQYRDQNDIKHWQTLDLYKNDYKVYKISFKANNDKDFLAFENEIKHQYEIFYGVNVNDFFGEITKLNNSKGSVFKKLAKLNFLNINDCISIGDSPNDIEMLKSSSIGIAMGNASDRVKAYADIVCADVRDDGFYQAFLEMNLIGEIND